LSYSQQTACTPSAHQTSLYTHTFQRLRLLLLLYAAVKSGAMTIDSKQCTITDTLYSNNTAQSTAGAILVDSGNITISNSVLTYNSAYGKQFGLGGAIALAQGCNGTFMHTTISHNTATGGSGGAINTNSDAYITGCRFETNTATFGGAIRYGPTGILTVDNTVFSDSVASTTGGANQSSTNAVAAVLSDTVVFSNNTAFCCYAKALSTHTTTANSTCVDIAYQENAISECCAANTYSDGNHCQLCTTELICAGIVGANTSTVVLPNGVWRASTTSLKTYTCWNSDACIGGVAVRSTNDYCATGYIGPCKYCHTDILRSMQVTLCTNMCVLLVRYALLCL
jgi:predicted outer membrane repeat protein